MKERGYPEERTWILMDKLHSVVFYTHSIPSIDFLNDSGIYRRKVNGNWAGLGNVNIYIMSIFFLKKCTLQSILS